MSFHFQRPGIDDINAYLYRQRDMPFSYEAVGATRHERVPAGFNCDRHQVLLGHGEDVFRRGQQAVRQWQMFAHKLVQLYWPGAPIVAGTCVAALFRAGPLWSVNPCRIVYTIDESEGPWQRFGFAYGTLPDHLECGEERFLVLHNRADGAVSYELYCFSRPRHPLARVGYPYVRLQQARFRRLSGEAMQRAVSETDALACPGRTA